MEIFYNIFFLPFEILLELILNLCFSLTNNYGISIICLSIIVNIVLLPIHIIGQKSRKKDKIIKEQMRDMLDKIKKNYQGRERYFYTQTYYKINKYNPLSAIKASLSFLGQIPFFVAAFYLLLNYEPLYGKSFWLLKDLSKPDEILLGVNFLPIFMTVIYFLSFYIQKEKFEKSEKYQIYSIGLIFIVLLYSQSSGLLLYWTTNNLFSLLKNLFENTLFFNSK